MSLEASDARNATGPISPLASPSRRVVYQGTRETCKNSFETSRTRLWAAMPWPAGGPNQEKSVQAMESFLELL